MCVHPAAPARSRPAAVASDLDAVEGQAPHGQAVHDRRGDVADDGGPVELGHRGPDQQLVVQGRVLRPGAFDVRTASHGGQGAGPQHAVHLVGGVAGRPQLPGAVQPLFHAPSLRDDRAGR